jgi:hypothetical protein
VCRTLENGKTQSRPTLTKAFFFIPAIVNSMTLGFVQAPARALSRAKHDVPSKSEPNTPPLTRVREKCDVPCRTMIVSFHPPLFPWLNRDFRFPIRASRKK